MLHGSGVESVLWGITTFQSLLQFGAGSQVVVGRKMKFCVGNIRSMFSCASRSFLFVSFSSTSQLFMVCKNLCGKFLLRVCRFK